MELNADFSRRAAVHAARLAWTPSPIAGVERRMLDRIGDEVARENVRLEHWQPGAAIALAEPGGAEFLVLDGDFEEGAERFGQQSWLRLPSGSVLGATAGPAGCKVWVKTGHLRHVRAAPSAPRA